MEAYASDSSAPMLPDHRQAPSLHAGFWRRAAAWCIDVLVLGAIQLVFTLAFGTWVMVAWVMLGGSHDPGMARFVDICLQPFALVTLWLYYAVFESSRWQATPGKLVLGLKVADVRGHRIGFGRAGGRYLGKFVSAFILFIGYMQAGWSPRKQALHDLLAGCCVVRKRGLAAWLGETSRSSDTGAGLAPPVLRPARSGWAVALIVVTVSVFVVIPVLAIVAALAIPAYRGYSARTEVAEGVELTERPRALVAEYIGVRGALPGSNADLGLPSPETIRTRYVTSVRIVEGKVVVTYGNEASTAIRGGHVVIAPEGNAAMLRWQCSSPDIDARYLPAACQR